MLSISTGIGQCIKIQSHGYVRPVDAPRRTRTSISCRGEPCDLALLSREYQSLPGVLSSVSQMPGYTSLTAVCFAPNPPPIRGFSTRILALGNAQAPWTGSCARGNTIWVDEITCSLPYRSRLGISTKRLHHGLLKCTSYDRYGQAPHRSPASTASTSPSSSCLTGNQIPLRISAHLTWRKPVLFRMHQNLDCPLPYGNPEPAPALYILL